MIMELHSGVVVFLCLLSTLLFGSLMFSSLHNAHQIANLQLQLQQLSDECNHHHEASSSSNTENVIINKLMKEMIKMSPNENQEAINQLAFGHRPKRSAISISNQDSNDTESDIKSSKADPDDPSIVTLQLLAIAFSDIVNRQLNSKLDCSQLEEETECTIQPGPKGERGERGPQGLQGATGEKGDKGVSGEQGAKGEEGQLGHTGFKGEKGAMGELGPQGAVGPQGEAGPVGPVATLRQNSCEWLFTDTCGHGCGTNSLRRATCPVGQYVAGFGIYTWNANGRYNTHIYCCPV